MGGGWWRRGEGGGVWGGQVRCMCQTVCDTAEIGGWGVVACGVLAGGACGGGDDVNRYTRGNSNPSCKCHGLVPFTAK